MANRTVTFLAGESVAMQLAERMGRVKPSATQAMNTKAQELRAAGRDVVSLAVGQPDYTTPEFICQAGKRAIDEGLTKYTAVPGIPEVREAVAGYFRTAWGVEARAEQTMVTNGGKQAIFNLLMALLSPGDEVIIIAPYWVSYPDMVRLADGEPVYVHTRAADRFLATVDQLEAVRTPRTRMLIINTPSNPTGCHYTQAGLDDIARWAAANNILVLSDEVYDQLVYAPSLPATFAHWFAADPEHFAIVGALSKTYAMTGWRVGYALADPMLIGAAAKVQGQSTSNICSVSQHAAVTALTEGWDFIAKKREVFARRREAAIAAMGQLDRARCPEPDGAFYLFPDVSEYYTDAVPDSLALCTRVLDEAGVALVPGAAFGDDACVRFSYALDTDTFADAVERVATVMRAL